MTRERIEITFQLSSVETERCAQWAALEATIEQMHPESYIYGSWVEGSDLLVFILEH